MAYKSSIENQKYLTIAEAAEYLRSTPKQLYKLRHEGRLTTYQFGRKVLIKRADLDRTIESSRKGDF